MSTYKFKDKNGKILGYGLTCEVSINQLFTELYTNCKLEGTNIVKTKDVDSVEKVRKVSTEFRDLTQQEIMKIKMKGIFYSGKIKFKPSRDEFLLKLIHMDETQLDDIISRIENLGEGIYLVVE